MNRYFPALQMIILWISLLCIISSSAESALLRASANEVSNTLIRYSLSSYDLWYSVAEFRHCALYCHFLCSRVCSDTNNLKSSLFFSLTTIGDLYLEDFIIQRQWGDEIHLEDCSQIELLELLVLIYIKLKSWYGKKVGLRSSWAQPKTN